VAAIVNWYNEVSLYNFAQPGFSGETGHFTQVCVCVSLCSCTRLMRVVRQRLVHVMCRLPAARGRARQACPMLTPCARVCLHACCTQVVWKGSASLGCAVTRCTPLQGLPWASGTYVVCRYNPPGNYLGQFGQNVLPAVTTPAPPPPPREWRRCAGPAAGCARVLPCALGALPACLGRASPEAVSLPMFITSARFTCGLELHVERRTPLGMPSLTVAVLPCAVLCVQPHPLHPHPHHHVSGGRVPRWLACARCSAGSAAQHRAPGVHGGAQARAAAHDHRQCVPALAACRRHRSLPHCCAAAVCRCAQRHHRLPQPRPRPPPHPLAPCPRECR
jgi:hypothetical protein